MRKIFAKAYGLSEKCQGRDGERCAIGIAGTVVVFLFCGYNFLNRAMEKLNMSDSKKGLTFTVQGYSIYNINGKGESVKDKFFTRQKWGIV